MKKKLALVMAAAMTMTALTINVSAEETEYPQVTVLIDGEEIESDQPAVIIDSRTLVPIRVIAESIGVDVEWEADTKTVVFEKDGLTASMAVGELTLNISDGTVTYPVNIDTPAVILNGRTLVPVRFISEYFKAEVDWDDATRTVSITTPAALAAAEESTEETTEEAAPAEGMAYRELIDQAELADFYIGQLNESVDDMDEEQSETFSKYCDTVATIQQTLDSEKYTDEEIAAGAEELETIIPGLQELAEALDITLVEPEEEAEATDEDKTSDEEKVPTVDEIKALAEDADAMTGKINDAEPEFEKEDEEAYTEQCDKVATVFKIMDTTDLDEDDEYVAAKDALDGAVDLFTEIAEKYDIEL